MARQKLVADLRVLEVRGKDKGKDADDCLLLRVKGGDNYLRWLREYIYTKINKDELMD